MLRDKSRRVGASVAKGRTFNNPCRSDEGDPATAGISYVLVGGSRSGTPWVTQHLEVAGVRLRCTSMRPHQSVSVSSCRAFDGFARTVLFEAQRAARASLSLAGVQITTFTCCF